MGIGIEPFFYPRGISKFWIFTLQANEEGLGMAFEVAGLAFKNQLILGIMDVPFAIYFTQEMRIIPIPCKFYGAFRTEAQ